MDVPLSSDAVSGAIVIGKLPFHGDFIARGISGAEQRQIDRWLTASLATARDEFGSAFDASFDTATPWRFAWRDEQWTAGTLAPSADSAGRRFPLLVAMSNLTEGQVEAGARFCEEAASEAIASRWTADRLVEAIAASDVETDGTLAAEGWWNDNLGEAARLQDREPPMILARMLAPVPGAIG